MMKIKIALKKINLKTCILRTKKNNIKIALKKINLKTCILKTKNNK